MLLCHVVLVGGRRDVLYAAAAAVVVMLAYNVMIAPALVQAINGYRPSLESQRLPLAELAGHPRLFKWAVILLAETSARLLGDVPPAVCLVVFLLVVMLTVRRWRGAGVAPRISSPSPTTARSWTGWRVAFVAVLVALAHIVMYAVMIARFPPLWDHYDHRLWYYPVPFQAFLLTILVVGFNFIASSWTRARFAMLNAVLGAVIVANVLRWDDNVRLQRQSQWFNTVHTESYILKRSLSDGRAYSTHAGYLPFYRYCLKLSPTLRERAEE